MRSYLVEQKWYAVLLYSSLVLEAGFLLEVRFFAAILLLLSSCPIFEGVG